MPRPPKVIDWDEVETLCKIQCTSEEIYAVIRVTSKTLAKHCQLDHGMSFSEFKEKHAADGKASLRRLQNGTAKDGDVRMQIHLGKVYLGQSDKLQVDANVHVDTSTTGLIKASMNGGFQHGDDTDTDDEASEEDQGAR